LAFKPDTDDIREAPSLYMIDKLVEAGAEVTAFDPEAMGNVRELIGNKIKYASNQYEAITGADMLLITTEWSVFRNPDFEKVATLLNEKVIFDGTYLYDTERMRDLGFYYKSIGRNVVNN